MHSNNETKHYADYLWKNGKPKGINPTTELNETTYKVIADPYYKRISLEKYKDGAFDSLIYDSALFDFRHLKPVEQNAWQKKLIREDENESLCYIRNQDDRLILMEHYFFEDQICRECRTSSPHGVLLSVQKILYEKFGDPFNGVVLYDTNAHVVMYKRYAIDISTQTFENLLEECVDMSEKTALWHRISLVH